MVDCLLRLERKSLFGGVDVQKGGVWGGSAELEVRELDPGFASGAEAGKCRLQMEWRFEWRMERACRFVSLCSGRSCVDLELVL